MIIKMDVGVIDNIQPLYGAFHLPLSLLSCYNTEVVACLLHKVTLLTLGLFFFFFFTILSTKGELKKFFFRFMLYT